MAVPLFTKRSENPGDLAFREGRRPGDLNQLGPNPNPVFDPRDFANSFVQQKFNPDSKNFWNSSVFSSETAGLSQNKINAASQTDFSTFKDPRDDQFARDFLTKYSGPGGAIERGLVNPEDAITKERLGSLVTQYATAASNSKMKDTAGITPGQQGVSVG